MNAAGRYVRSWHFSDVTAALRMSAVEGRTEVRIAGPDFRFLTHKRHPPDLVVPQLPAPRNFEVSERNLGLFRAFAKIARNGTGPDR
jgi:hypothetical protein